jgi:transglutaminase-like putative cysteine protease
MDEYLKATPLLDYENESIQYLLKTKNWEKEDYNGKIRSAYNFVRDDILFGYNIDDDISASKVLSDGYGQCNTKGTLFMALLRALKIPCRLHGFTIDKILQKGAMTGFVYNNAPEEIVHSWVEVWIFDKWVILEGFILERKRFLHE